MASRRRLMDFSFSKELELLRASIEEFCKKGIDPRICDWIKERAFPRALLEKLSRTGLTGMNIPEGLGGSPLDNVSQCCRRDLGEARAPQYRLKL